MKWFGSTSETKENRHKYASPKVLNMEIVGDVFVRLHFPLYDYDTHCSVTIICYILNRRSSQHFGSSHRIV